MLGDCTQHIELERDAMNADNEVFRRMNEDFGLQYMTAELEVCFLEAHLLGAAG